MGEATQGNIRAARLPGGNITLDTTHTDGGLIRNVRRRPWIEIERADLDDAIATLQALRGDWRPTVGGAVEAMNIARAGQNGIVARNQGGSLPWVVRHPDGCETGYAAHEIRPWSEPRSPVARRPIERYVRAAVEIRMPAANVPGAPPYLVAGTVELGLHYEDRESPYTFRDKLIEVADRHVRDHFVREPWRGLDEDTADSMTRLLDSSIVNLWGDRPRFIEVWRGTGDDAEPLTQVYAPYGMPIPGTP